MPTWLPALVQLILKILEMLLSQQLRKARRANDQERVALLTQALGNQDLMVITALSLQSQIDKRDDALFLADGVFAGDALSILRWMIENMDEILELIRRIFSELSTVQTDEE